MKKIIRSLTVFLVAALLCLSVFPITSFASNTILAFSKNKVSVGDKVTVSVTVRVDEMYATNITGSYNENVLTYVSGASSGGAGLFQITEALSGENKKTFSVTFKAKKAGSSPISVSGTVGAGIPPMDIVIEGAGASLTVEDVTLSSNANLKSLSLSAGSLSPRFSKSQTSYTVNVKNNVTQCKIYAETEDSDATVSVEGSSTLKVGANKRVVTVTAPAGNKKSYTVTINRAKPEPVSSLEETSSEEDTSDASSTLTDEDIKLETIINGVAYKVLKDISSVTIPEGFDIGKRVYNGEDVAVAMDKNKEFELYYLTSAEDKTPVAYTYNEEQNAFTRVLMLTQNNSQYIVADIPVEYTAPTGYTLNQKQINNVDVSCYVSENELYKDFYYIYCYSNNEYSTYSYDALNNTLQRSPEFSFLSADSSDALAGIGEDNFFSRFDSLSTNAKTILVCLLIAAVGVILLIALLIIKLVNRNRMPDYDDYDFEDDFDSVEFDDDFKIVSDEDEE